MLSNMCGYNNDYIIIVYYKLQIYNISQKKAYARYCLFVADINSFCAAAIYVRFAICKILDCVII